uniref:Uncharacterized protein n=1 Tax=Arundo donax TaxID=35708 RepID=A0A0A8XWF8_ARUDO
MNFIKTASSSVRTAYRLIWSYPSHLGLASVVSCSKLLFVGYKDPFLHIYLSRLPNEYLAVKRLLYCSRMSLDTALTSIRKDWRRFQDRKKKLWFSDRFL